MDYYPMSHAEYYYVDPDNVEEDQLKIEGDEFHHLVNVCRNGIGDIFYAVNGAGMWYECELAKIETTEVEARILNSKTAMGESSFKLTVAQALPKGNRFDLVVEKCTEIGVFNFIPMNTDRSITATHKKIERWRRLSLASMKQSGRSVWPEIVEPKLFKDIVKEFRRYKIKFIAHQGYKNPISHSEISRLKTTCNSGIILIGPAGGFTDSEIELAGEYGFKSMNLGPRRLRSETAAIVAATILLS